MDAHICGVLSLVGEERQYPADMRTRLFLLQLHFISNLHEIWVTYVILDAEKHPAIRKPLCALLFELQYTVEKEGVAGHALNINFEKFSLRLF